MNVMMRNTIRRLSKITRWAMLFGGTLIIVSAPVAQASISKDELPEFAKWPLYQECDFGDVETQVSAGLTVTGTSPFLMGDPMILTYPAITNEAQFAAAMEAFIKKTGPNSPWARITNIGEKLRAEAKLRNVNPMMIIVIGRHETQYGGDGGGSARNNNSFGNKGNGPNGYRTWPSVEASLVGDDSFTKLVADRINHAPSAPRNYDNVKNMYEYLSVHISGQIIYPGDNTSVHDELMNVSVTIKNVMQYFDYAKTWIGEMTGLKIEGIPQRSAAGATPAGTGDPTGVSVDCNQPGPTTDEGGSGVVNADGYSFPLEDQTKRNYGASGPPCAQENRGCHHTGGVKGKNLAAAFDLMYGGNETMSGKKVYAISNGVITRRNDAYREVQGCYSISFRSSKDGLNYWYGHLQNADESIAVGQPIEAGRQIAEVAGTKFGPQSPICHGRSAGAEPGSHLHIDRGCPGYSGGGSCRDISFVKFMNTMWSQLPPPGSRGIRTQ